MKSEPFSCTRGGLTIRGHIYGRTGSSQPAVILSHGFLANESMCAGYAELLASQGFVTFTYDFCGGGPMVRSDGRTQDMTVFTEVNDLRAVLAYVQGLDWVDSTRISLLGCSQGGFVSALVAHDIPKQIHRLMLLYPALCIPDDARRGQMLMAKFDPDNIPEIVMHQPMKLGGCYPRAVIRLDAFEAIRSYPGPVLLLHGTADRVVSVGYARRAKGVYADCTYVEIEGGTHVFHGDHERQAREAITAFMANV